MSIATEISRIKDAKDAIRASIIAKGVNVPQAAKLDTYADRIDEIVQTASGNMEVVTSSPSGTINAADNKFYMLSGDAGALVFNLPAMQQGGHGIYLLMTTASTSAVSFTSEGSVTINFPTGFQVEADKCYLMDFEFAQSAWQVSVEEWFVNGSDKFEAVLKGILDGSATELKSDDFPQGLTAIRGSMFRGAVNLKKLQFPDTVTTLGVEVFSGCGVEEFTYPPLVKNTSSWRDTSSIKSVIMPEGMTTIDSFQGCYNLQYVSIPSTLTTVSTGAAFQYCTGLRHLDMSNTTVATFPLNTFWIDGVMPHAVIKLPSTITQLGNRFLISAKNVTLTCLAETPPTLSNTIPSGLPVYVPASSVSSYQSASNWSSFANRIKPVGWTPEVPQGAKAELWLSSVTGSTAFPTITDDGSGEIKQSERIAISNVNNTTYVIIGDTVTTIGLGAFTGMQNLYEVVMPSVTTLETDAFSNSQYLSSVYMPNVTSIGVTAFNGCSRLLTVDLPSVTTISDNAFSGCSKLETIDIGANITQIGGYVFTNNTSLKSFTCLATTPPACGTKIFGSTPSSSLVIYVPAESVDAYKAATNWKTYADRIQAIPEP